MALYLVVSPQKVYVDYENGTVLGFSTGNVLDAAPGLRSIVSLTQANPAAIVPFVPTTAFTALPAGVAGGAATLDSTGQLTASQIPASDDRWVKVTKTFSDLAAAALTNNIEVYSLPAGGVIHAVKIKHSASFTGGAIATYTLSVGITGTLAKYAAAFNVFQAPGATVQQISSTVGTENHTAATSIKLAATSTVGTLDAATAGSVDIWLDVSTAV